MSPHAWTTTAGTRMPILTRRITPSIRSALHTQLAQVPSRHWHGWPTTLVYDQAWHASRLLDLSQTVPAMRGCAFRELWEEIGIWVAGRRERRRRIYATSVAQVMAVSE